MRGGRIARARKRPRPRRDALGRCAFSKIPCRKSKPPFGNITYREACWANFWPDYKL